MPTLFNRTAQAFFLTPTQRIDIDGLRIVFEYTKALVTNPDRGVIKIYNLAPKTLSLIEEAKRVGLNAGYKDISSAFEGDVGKVSPVRTKEGDHITTIEIVDGIDLLQKALTNETFPSGTSFKQIFEKLFGDMGQNPQEIFESIIGVDLSKKTDEGITLSGRALDIAKRFGDSFDIDFFTNDGILKAIEKGKSTLQEAVIISPETGMLDAPRKSESGIEVKSFLNPLVEPGRKIEIRSKLINGLAVVDEVMHSGDTRENAWFSDINCKLIPES